MIKVTLINDQISKELERIKRDLIKLPNDSANELKRTTPIKSGNAKNKTTLKSKESIVADYPYATRLDNGWSKQAPKGMTKPFDTWIRNKVNKIFGK